MSQATKKPRIIRRAFKGTVDDIDEKKRTVRAIITSDAIDRYGEVIEPKGIRVDNYLKNPVVLWCHDSRRPPIAKNLDLKRKSQQIIANTLFDDEEFADKVFQLYVKGFLNGWSIGARPIWKFCSGPTPDEIKARPELKDCDWIIRACELIEYSAVSIPANQEALGSEIGKSIERSLLAEIAGGDRWDDDRHELARTSRSIEPDNDPEPEEKTEPAPIIKELPELIGRTFGEVVAMQQSLIRRMAGRDAVERNMQDVIDRVKGRV